MTKNLQFNSSSCLLYKENTLRIKSTNKLISNIKKSHFSTTRPLLITTEELIRQRKEIRDKLIELDKERQILKNDLENISEAVPAASKIAMEEPLSKEDTEILKDFKDNYPAFIDSEDEDGPPSLLNKFRQLRRYFKSELKVNTKSMRALTEKRADVIAQQNAQASSSKTDSTNEIVEASSSRTVAPNQLKRKADYSDSEESKRSRNTPTSDYIDDLPELPYNPLDDIGFD